EGRFKDAATMLNYGFGVSDIYIDENITPLPSLMVEGGVEEMVDLHYQSPFYYLDTEGNSLDMVEKSIELPELVKAPVMEGDTVGRAVYRLGDVEIGEIPIVFSQDVDKAGYKYYLWDVILQALL
ncbi:MAG: D-alanyl-D-alanine carboxypeptidase, partial [Lachnospiraceae bacterium]|nr:D-alanyl-D-alanine carboxypeptidase [Lachnospiraceae bacterium]